MKIIEAAYVPDAGELLKKLGIGEGSDEAGDFLPMLETATKIAKPLAAIGMAAVEPSSDGKRVRVGGVEFKSGLLAENLAKAETVWPYFATCGRAVYDWTQSIADPFERYWAEEIMQQALSVAMRELDRHFTAEIYAGKTAVMNPGSLADWPIGEQAPLFRLFGPAAAAAGITLTDTMLMLPNKSVSGIRFPNEHGYVNCQLCPKENCPNRKAVYDSEMAAAHG